MQKIKTSNPLAFSLMEFMLALVLIGTFMIFAIPGYQKTVERTKEKQAAVNLMIIINAVKQYYLDNNAYPANLNNVTEINATFGLSVIAYNTMLYRCLFGGPSIYECRAAGGGGIDWALHGDGINGDPHCLLGSCPLCTTTACPYIN